MAADPNLQITPGEVPEATSQAPTPKISGGEIAQPYEMLARSLSKVGQGLEDLATPLAEQAGYKSVTRDAQGNIQVDRMPIFGKAGDAYAHAVKMGALAQGEGDAKRADIELREKYRDDPQGYQTAAQAFKDKTMAQYQAAAGPEVATSLGAAIDNTTTYTYRGLLNEKERLDLQRAESQMNAGVKDATDDLMALSRQGANVNDPAFKTAFDKYTQLLDAKASNPRLAYSQEMRAYDLQHLQGELGGQRFLYHTDQTYQEKGYEVAANEAKDILSNPAYKLTPAQRDHYYHQAINELHSNEAVRNQDVQAINEQFKEVKAQSALGNAIDPEQINSLRRSYQQIGGVKGGNGVAAIDAWAAHVKLHDNFGNQPIADQNREFNTIAGAAAARDIYQGLVRRGWNEAAAAGMAGNIVWESGMRTGAIGDYGTSGGLAQWHGERLQALKEFATSRGKPWTDKETQLDFVDRELRTTESVTGGLMRAVTTPEEAARVFAAGFERPKGTDYSGREKLARSIAEGKACDESTGPGCASWLIANRAATLKTSATETWGQAVKDWNNGAGPVPSKQTIEETAEAARNSNNIDLSARMQRDLELMDVAERIKQLPLDTQEAIETEQLRRIAAGETRPADVPAAMDTPGADLVLKTLQERSAAIRKGLKDNPIATTINSDPQRWKTPEPLDPSNPQQFVAGLAQRAQIARAGAYKWRVPPLSALDDKDVERVQAALATPDLGQRAQIWGTLATLPDDVRGPTFEKIAKGDPNSRAEASAGSMMATDPAMAKSIMAGLDIMRDKGILKVFEPKSSGTEGFNTDLPTMLPPSVYDSKTRLNPQGNYSTTSRMIQARYAYLAANDPKGGGEYSKARLQQAVNDVTGGTVRMNGGTTLAPSRGMTQSQFEGVMAGITDRDLGGVTDLNGHPLTANMLRGMGRLEAIGPGRYLVNLSKGDPPIYAYNGWGDAPGGGDRFVLDLTGKPPVYGTPDFAAGFGPLSSRAGMPEPLPERTPRAPQTAAVRPGALYPVRPGIPDSEPFQPSGMIGIRG
jgi:hypothetical protein